MRFVLCVAFLQIVAAFVSTAQTPKIPIQPERSWVQKFTINKEAAPPAGQQAGYYYLLLDRQQNVSEEETYHHYAYKFFTNEGIQQFSDINISFDPNFEKLIIHKVVVHRHGEVINKCPAAIKAIQHEEGMDRFLYDDSFTAVLNLPDIRVGDILEYSYSIEGFNPAFEGHIMEDVYANTSASFESKVFRLIVPESTGITMKNVNTDVAPVVTRDGNSRTYAWTFEKVSGLVTDFDAPYWYNPFGRVMISSFRNWREVSDWGTRLYKVSDQDVRSLRMEVDKILPADTSEEFVLGAIRFVQDDVRYLGFEGGLNGYKPHSPLQVWRQRFGDCKDKSLLLCTILRLRGIDAYPVLVNTTERDKIKERLPSIIAFDHCVAQFHFNGKTYSIDPTISNQGGMLDTYPFPYYGAGLPLNGADSLISMEARNTGYQKEVQTFRMDSIGGGATMEVVTVFQGMAADVERAYFSNARLDAVKKRYLDYYADQYPAILSAGDIIIGDDRDENTFFTKEKYVIPKFWEKESETGEKIYCAVKAMSLESKFNVSKSAGRTAPYALEYPFDKRLEINIHTPTDWSITPDASTIKTDYYAYRYRSTYKNRLITISTEYKTKSDAVPVEAIGKFIDDHSEMWGNISFYLTWDPGITPVTSAPLWPGLLTLIFALAGFIPLAIYAYRRYDPQPFYPPAWGQRIEGWLFLPAFGLTMMPFTTVFRIISDPVLINGQPWQLQYLNGNTALFFISLLEQVYTVGSIVFGGLIMVLFFRRRSSLPALITYYYGIPVLWLVFTIVLLRTIAPDDYVGMPTRDILLTVIPAAIWIPYFRYSQRVKRTFVNRYNRNDNDAVASPSVAEVSANY